MATSTFAVSQLRDEISYVDPAAATNRTVTLDKPAFDDTHTLVAMVYIPSATALVTPNGWTPVGTGGANSGNQLRIYIRRGDSVTKSITIESTSFIMEVSLQVYAGYAGLTQILGGGANGTSGNNFPFSGISGPAGNGITILGIGLSTAPSSWTGWSGSVNPVPDTNPTSRRSWYAVEDYINGASENSTVSWASSRNQRYIVAVIPLVAAASIPKGGGSLNYNIGVSGSGSKPAVSNASGSGTLNYSIGTSGSGSQPAVGSARGGGSLSYSIGTSGSGFTSRKGSGSLSFEIATEGVGRKPGSTDTSALPTRAQMPTNLLTDLYPAPTYEWSSGFGPMSAPYQWKNWDDALIKLTDAAAKGVVAGTANGFVQAAPLADISGAGTGSNTQVFPPYGIKIRTDSKDVYIRLRQRSYSGFSNVSARASSRLRVNGKLTSTNPVYLGSTIGFPTNPENIVPGEYYVKFSFPTAEMRTLEFTTHLEFGGLAVNAEATMVAPPASKHRFVVLDGSLSGSEKHQTGNFALTGGSAGTYTAISSMFYMAAMALGFDEAINLATGSSGYAINGDTVSFKTAAKLSELLSHSPAAVFLGSPNNDIGAGQSASQVNTNTAFVLNYIRTNLPNVPIFMMGAFTPPVMGSQASAESTVAPYNAVMKANAQTYGAWFVNPTTGETFDPSGTRRMVTSNWVYQNTSNIASDNQHPTQSGANTLGVMFADSIKMAFPEGTVPKGSGSLDYGISASGTGTAPRVAVHHGFGVLSYGLDGSGNGKTAKSGSGSLSFGESVQGSGSTIHRGSGSLGFSESVSGSGKVKRSGSGSLSYIESVTGLGSSPRHGHGELQLGVTAEGSGRAPVTIPATGGGSLSFKMGGNGSGSNPRRGEGSLGFTHAMSGSGETSRLGSGSLSFGLNSSGVGTILKAGGGSLEYVMETSGSGKTTPVSMHRGSGSLSYTEALSGSGSTARFGEGTLSYSVAIRGSGGNRGAAISYFGDKAVSLAFGDTPVSLA